MSKIRNNRLLITIALNLLQARKSIEQKHSNQLIRASPQLVATEDKDLVLVDLSERQAPTCHRSQITITTSNSAAESPSAGLSEMIQISQQFLLDRVELLLIMHGIQDSFA